MGESVPVRAELAGSITIEAAETVEESALAGRRPRLAFALLVLERGRAVPREEIATALWGERLPASWAPSLREVMSKVRAFLAAAGLPPRETLSNAFGCYQLNLPEPLEVDVERAAAEIELAGRELEQGDAERAAALAESADRVLARPFLPGLDGDWIESKRRELASLRERALFLLAEAATETGDAVGAVAIAERLVELSPFSDQAHAALVRAHVASGARGEALRAYDRYRRRMVTELGVGPSADLQELFRDLLGNEAVPEADGGPSGLVGREEEARQLARLLDDANEGSGQILFLTGPAGIGKSAMVASVAGLAGSRGWKVIMSEAWEMGMRPLAPLLEALGPDSRLGEPGVAGDPHLASREVVRMLAAESAGMPLLLVIEDLHLADHSTLAVLARIAAEGELPRDTLVVATGREGEPARLEESEEALAELIAATRTLRLGPVGEGDLEALAERLGLEPREGLGRELLEETGGNPLHAIEVIRHLLESRTARKGATGGAVPFGDLSVPPGIDEVVFTRFTRLGDQPRLLLEVASVAGEASDPALIRAVTGWSEGELRDTLAVTTEAGFTAALAGTVRFSHDVHRRAILDRMSRTTLRGLHAAVARALEASGEAAPDLLADHWAEAAPGDVQGIRYARLAGREAVASAAYVEAIAWFRVALEQDALGNPDPESRVELLALLGQALKLNGEVVQSEAAYLEGARIAREAVRGDLLARIAISMAGFNRYEPSISPVSVELLEEASSAPPGEMPEALRVGLIARKAQFGAAMGAEAGLDPATAEALEIARSTGESQVLVQGLAARLHAMGGPERAAERLELAGELMALATGEGETEAEILALEHQIWSFFELGRYIEARAGIDRFMGISGRLRIPAVELFAAQYAACLASIGGRFKDVDRHVGEVGDAAARSVDPRMAESSKVLTQIVPRWLQGTFATLAPAIEAIVAWQPDLESFEAARAFSLLATGDRPAAVAAFEALIAAETLGEEPHGSLWAFDFFYHSLLAAEFGGEAARRVFERGESYSGMQCSYRGLIFCGSYDHHLGRLAIAFGDPRLATGHLDRAVEQYAAMSAGPWLALAREDQARAGA